MADYHHKKGNLLPPYRGTVSDANGPVNLSLASSVLFRMWDRNTRQVVIDDQPVQIVDGPAGKFSYGWQAADVDAIGTYLAEVDVVYPSGVLTCPNPGAIVILISERGPDGP